MQNIPPQKRERKKRARLTIINIDKHKKLKFSNTD